MRIGIDYTTGVYGGTGIGRYTRGLAHALAAIDRENEYTLLWARANGPDHTSPYDIGHMFAPCLARIVVALASRNAEPCDDLRPFLATQGITICPGSCGEVCRPPCSRNRRTSLDVEGMPSVR